MQNGKTNFNIGKMYQYVNYAKLYPTETKFKEKSSVKFDFTPKPTKSRSWIA